MANQNPRSTSRCCSWSSGSSASPCGATARSAPAGARGRSRTKSSPRRKGASRRPTALASRPSRNTSTWRRRGCPRSRGSPATSRWQIVPSASRSTFGRAGARLFTPTTASGRARSGRRPAARISSWSWCSLTIRSRCATRTPPATSTSAGRPSICCRFSWKGSGRTRASCRASTSRSTGPTAATASWCATRSRRWRMCAGRRSCSRRTRRRTTSC